MDAKQIEEEARRELDAENHRAAVEKAKARLRERDSRTLWERIFPFKIVIVRR